MGFHYGFCCVLWLFDLFYGCLIEMSPKHRTFSAYDPMEYKSMVVAKKLNGREWFWLDNVPHVQAKVNGKEVIKRLIRAKVEAFSRFICGLIARRSNGIFSRFICALLAKVLLATM